VKEEEERIPIPEERKFRSHKGTSAVLRKEILKKHRKERILGKEILETRGGLCCCMQGNPG
jgi:hypothetical protein